MNDQPIFITDDDAYRIRRLLKTKRDLAGADEQHLRNLKDKLDRAVIVQGTEISAGVVTMGSQFRLKRLDTGAVGEYTLVFPDEADMSRGKVSVLAPIGTALLGYQERDIIECHVSAGLKRFQVERMLHQPGAKPPTARAASYDRGANWHPVS